MGARPREYNLRALSFAKVDPTCFKHHRLERKGKQSKRPHEGWMLKPPISTLTGDDVFAWQVQWDVRSSCKWIWMNPTRTDFKQSQLPYLPSILVCPGALPNGARRTTATTASSSSSSTGFGGPIGWIAWTSSPPVVLTPTHPRHELQPQSGQPQDRGRTKELAHASPTKIRRQQRRYGSAGRTSDASRCASTYDKPLSAKSEITGRSVVASTICQRRRATHDLGCPRLSRKYIFLRRTKRAR